MDLQFVGTFIPRNIWCNKKNIIFQVQIRISSKYIINNGPNFIEFNPIHQFFIRFTLNLLIFWSFLQLFVHSSYIVWYFEQESLWTIFIISCISLFRSFISLFLSRQPAGTWWFLQHSIIQSTIKMNTNVNRINSKMS